MSPFSVVLCSTGLSSSERRALDEAIASLDGVQYHGDLTCAHFSAHTPRAVCAAALYSLSYTLRSNAGAAIGRRISWPRTDRA